MGLLDAFDDPVKLQALGLLGQGLMRRDFGSGASAAMGLLAAQPDIAMKRELLRSQIDENRAQIEERRGKLKSSAELQAMLGNLFGAGGLSSPQVSPSAFAPAADGVGPTLPENMLRLSAPGSRMANLGFDQLAALKMRGLDLTDLHKYANDPLKMEGGATYENRVTGKREYMPKVGDGMAPNGSGGFTDAPGYAEGVGRIAGATTRANEAAKAGFDLVQVYNPQNQQMEFRPRAQVLGNQQPQPQFSPQPMQQPMQTRVGLGEPAPTGAFKGDPTQIMESIIQIRDPQERANAMAAFQEQARRTPNFASGGFAAGPSASDAAAAAGGRVKAEADARALAERDNTKAKRSDQSTDMLGTLARARTLLSGGPTESGIGSVFDKLGSFAGISTDSANKAAALETIAETLTSSVPRMEGPQSNTDVANYRVQAGRVGDRTLPVAQRLASLNEVESIQKRYAHLNSGKSAQGNGGGKPQVGMVQDGYRFKGGNPGDPASWEKQ